MVRSMKKLMALICLITCAAVLGACGSQSGLSDYEQKKLDNAQTVAGQYIQVLDELSAEETLSWIRQFTGEEISYIIEQQYGYNADGDAVLAAAESFASAKKTIGTIVSVGETEADIDDDKIVVHVQIEGETKAAEAEIIVSNDLFMKFESGALNPVATLNDMMGKAVMNTIIGMGTVFAVLILIIGVISAMSLIPKLQTALENKKKSRAQEGAAPIEQTAVENAVDHIVMQESVNNAEEAEDTELVAVIAAAIAASEGAASPEDFVVRSIRRISKGRR